MKMAEGDFPVVFYDGEREINMGNERVKSSLNFKSFQLGLSQRIGISPNQITIYLVYRHSTAEPRRKIPITNKCDFSLLVRETECYFLVVLKRTRRYRRATAPESLEFAERMREMNIQRKRYLAEMSPPPPPDRRFLAGLGGFPTIRERFSVASCRECEAAWRERNTAAYHHCILDAVVVGFRPTAGPIAPPRKL